MGIDLIDYETRTREAVRSFWSTRESARTAQSRKGKSDVGERSSVTSGQNLNKFATLMKDVVAANGLGSATVHIRRPLVCLPGYFRPTKLWDLIVLHNGGLVAAIELKSHIGPSFGKNFNNRTEEAIGSATDLWTAFREGAFGKQPRPFVGWFILVEDARGSRRAISDKSPHFPVLSDFEGASYLRRYETLCRKLVQESLYTAAAVIAADRAAADSGKYQELSEITGMRTFVSMFAGHVAAIAAR